MIVLETVTPILKYNDVKEKQRKYITKLLERKLTVQGKIESFVFYLYSYGKLGVRILEGQC